MLYVFFYGNRILFIILLGYSFYKFWLVRQLNAFTEADRRITKMKWLILVLDLCWIEGYKIDVVLSFFCND